MPKAILSRGCLAWRLGRAPCPSARPGGLARGLAEGRARRGHCRRPSTPPRHPAPGRSRAPEPGTAPPGSRVGAGDGRAAYNYNEIGAPAGTVWTGILTPSSRFAPTISFNWRKNEELCPTSSHTTFPLSFQGEGGKIG